MDTGSFVARCVFYCSLLLAGCVPDPDNVVVSGWVPSGVKVLDTCVVPYSGGFGASKGDVNPGVVGSWSPGLIGFHSGGVNERRSVSENYTQLTALRQRAAPFIQKTGVHSERNP